MVAKQLRAKGGTVFHAPLRLAKDGSDNPNKGLGLLAGCAADELFAVGSWNAEICTALTPEPDDVVICRAHGMDAFMATDLEARLVAHGIETVVLGGFLTNCAVESTMRSAFEKGFNVITLTDCTVTPLPWRSISLYSPLLWLQRSSRAGWRWLPLRSRPRRPH